MADYYAQACILYAGDQFSKENVIRVKMSYDGQLHASHVVTRSMGLGSLGKLNDVREY